MNARTQRLVDLVAELVEARKEFTRIEGEIDELMGGDAGSAAPPKVKPADSPKPPPGRASASQIVELTKAGKSPSEIAAQLGVAAKGVHQHLWLARKRGLLPKAGRTA